MVAGYHLIWTAYGYWLPNDPRGSTSQTVRIKALEQLGDAHYGRKEVQPSSKTIREFHDQARDLLKHPVLTFDAEDIQLLGKTFAKEIAAMGQVCYACAIMPDHVHMLVRRHGESAEAMIERFQEASREALIETGKRLPTHPVWTKGPGWKGFMNTRRDFERTIDYIRKNPQEIGWPVQEWEFVSVYDGWMPPRRVRSERETGATEDSLASTYRSAYTHTN